MLQLLNRCIGKVLSLYGTIKKVLNSKILNITGDTKKVFSFRININLFFNEALYVFTFLKCSQNDKISD